jgi:hypothetical protein
MDGSHAAARACAATRHAQELLPNLSRRRLRTATQVWEEANAMANVFRVARSGEVAYEISRSAGWATVLLLRDRYTLGYIKSP